MILELYSHGFCSLRKQPRLNGFCYLETSPTLTFAHCKPKR